MRRRPALRLLLAVLPALLLAERPGTGARAAEPPAPDGVRGIIAWPNVSGATPLPGDRLLLTSATAGVAVLSEATSRLRSGRVVVREEEQLSPALAKRSPPVVVEDLQDAATDGEGNAYLVASHARTRLGEAPDERYRLLQLRWTAEGSLEGAEQSGALLQGIVADVPFLADSIRRPPARAGLAIEGLAWSPEGELLIGFRSPTVTESMPRAHGGQEDAVVARVTNPRALFASPPEPARLTEIVKLDLRGMGLRGMARGSGGYWLLAGLSVAPNYPVRSPWALWWWDGVHPPQSTNLPEAVRTLEDPAAVCPLKLDGKEWLLLAAPGEKESRFLLLPTPKL